MTRPFALKGKHFPKLSVPNGDNVCQRFSVSFREHFDTIDICLFTFSLPSVPLPQEGTWYGCSIRIWSCCGNGIPKEEVEKYIFTVLDRTLCRGRWVVAE
jgi:hypothetical protein